MRSAFQIILLLTLTAASTSFAQTKIYWAGDQANKIQRSNPDGSNIEDVPVNTIRPVGLAVDPAAGKIYWTERLTSRIQRANLDGTSAELLVEMEPNVHLRGMALDVDAGKMYWVAYGINSIQCADLDGGPVTTIVNLNGIGGLIGDGVAIDHIGNKIYWGNVHPANASIQRANLDGSGVEDVVTAEILGPYYLALDRSRSQVYWTERDAAELRRANLDGTGVSTVVILPSSPIGIALDPINSQVYWTQADGRVWRAGLDGSDPDELVSGLLSPWAIEIDRLAAAPSISNWGMIAFSALVAISAAIVGRRIRLGANRGAAGAGATSMMGQP